MYSNTVLTDAATLDALPLPVAPSLVDAFFGLDAAAPREVREYRDAAVAARHARSGAGAAAAAGSKRRRDAGDDEGGGDGGSSSDGGGDELAVAPHKDLTRRLHLVMARAVRSAWLWRGEDG